MKWATKIICLGLPLVLTGAVYAADEDLMTRGAEVYEEWCVICHGPDERGTKIMQDRYQGALPAELIKRKDLTAELITLRVRTWNALYMPVFRPTEVSDKDLEAVIAYLTNQ